MTVVLCSESHETAFNSAKSLMASTTALRYYDTHLLVTLKVQRNPALGPPRYYGHFFRPLSKSCLTLSCKKKKNPR